VNQAFSYEIRRRGYPENHNLADLALFDLLLDSLPQEFTFAGTISNAFVRAPTRWQKRLDYTSFTIAQAPRVPCGRQRAAYRPVEIGSHVGLDVDPACDLRLVAVLAQVQANQLELQHLPLRPWEARVYRLPRSDA
jgi:hypothetical protein